MLRTALSSDAIAAAVIGASAGATDALGVILPALPADFAIPIIMTVHIPKDVPNLLIELFGPKTKLRIVEVEDKSPIVAGTIYVAPPDYHVLVEADGCLSLSVEAPVHFSRPSIDVLFESAALVYGPRLVGVLLSGASEDGARGLGVIRERGGRTLVQDPTTAQVPVMPAAAIRLGAAERVLTLQEIAAYLVEASTRVHEARRALAAGVA
jgi:two-component system chemotaxis response regulator CheB